jgi:hypothetical protein
MKYPILFVLLCGSFTLHAQTPLQNDTAAIRKNHIKEVVAITFDANGQPLISDSMVLDAAGRGLYYGIRNLLRDKIQEEYIYTYGAAGRTALVNMNTVKLQYIYNKQNQLIETKRYDDGGQIIDHAVMQYVDSTLAYLVNDRKEKSVYTWKYDKSGRMTMSNIQDGNGLVTRCTFSYPSPKTKITTNYYGAEQGKEPMIFSVDTQSPNLTTTKMYSSTVKDQLVSVRETLQLADSIVLKVYNADHRLLYKGVAYLSTNGLIDHALYYNLARGEMLEKKVLYRYN